MKKLILLTLSLFIISCGKQTAPPLELQDKDKVQASNEVSRANLPKPQEATFGSSEPETLSATAEDTKENSIADQPEHGPAPDLEADKKLWQKYQKVNLKLSLKFYFLISPGKSIW